MHRNTIVLPADLDGNSLEDAGLLNGAKGRHLETISAWEFNHFGTGWIGNLILGAVLGQSVIQPRGRFHDAVISAPVPDRAQAFAHLRLCFTFDLRNQNSATFLRAAGMHALSSPRRTAKST